MRETYQYGKTRQDSRLGPGNSKGALLGEVRLGSRAYQRLRFGSLVDFVEHSGVAARIGRRELDIDNVSRRRRASQTHPPSEIRVARAAAGPPGQEPNLPGLTPLA